jgi:hypothetical protein
MGVGGVLGRPSLVPSVNRLVVRQTLSHRFTFSLTHAAQG